MAVFCPAELIGYNFIDVDKVIYSLIQGLAHTLTHQKNSIGFNY